MIEKSHYPLQDETLVTLAETCFVIIKLRVVTYL